MRDTSSYRAFVLRLWRSGKGQEGRWLASVEDPQSGERRGFASMEQLYAFLEQQTPSEEPEPSQPASARPATVRHD